MLTIVQVKAMHPDEMKRDREWRKLAEAFKIPLVENERLAQARRERALAAMEAELG